MRNLLSEANILAYFLPSGRTFANKFVEGSNVRRTLKGLAATALVVNEKLARVAIEYFPDTTTDLIGEWEQLVGIPNDCFKGDGDIETRRIHVLAMLRAWGVQTEQDFIDLAELLGYTISITHDVIDEIQLLPLDVPFIPAAGNDPDFIWVVRGLWDTPPPELQCFFNKLKSSLSIVQFKTETFVNVLESLGVTEYWLPNNDGTVLIAQKLGSDYDLVQVEPNSSTIDTSYIPNKYTNLEWVGTLNDDGQPRYESAVPAASLHLLGELTVGMFTLDTADDTSRNWTLRSGSTFSPSWWAARAINSNVVAAQLAAGGAVVNSNYVFDGAQETFHCYTKTLVAGINYDWRSYLDGVLADTVNLNNGAATDANDPVTFTFDKQSRFAGLFFFDRPLTPAEVAQLQAAALT